MSKDVRERSGKIIRDIHLCLWAALWAGEHGRKPKASELTREVGIALGKKVFEYLDYRDEYYPDMPDEAVYIGCLEDHGVDRDDMDGCDLSLLLKQGRDAWLKRHPDIVVWRWQDMVGEIQSKKGGEADEDS